MSARPVRAAKRPGGMVLTVSLVLSLLISLAADLNASHLFNPSWLPHAIFHDAAMLNLLTGTTGVALWLLWREGREPHVAAFVAWSLPVIFWSAFFWVTLVLPNASLNAVQGSPPPTVAGVPVLPNLVAAFAFVLLSSFGYWRYLRAARVAAESEA